MPSLEHSSEGHRNRPQAWEQHLWVIFLLLRKLLAESHRAHVEHCPQDGHTVFGVQAQAGLHTELHSSHCISAIISTSHSKVAGLQSVTATAASVDRFAQ